MSNWPLLSITTFLPLVGVFFILLVRGEDAGAKDNMRRVALITTVFTFLVSLFIWGGFDPQNPGFQFEESSEWLGGNIGYRMGVDGISVLFVMLTTFMMPLTILAANHHASSR